MWKLEAEWYELVIRATAIFAFLFIALILGKKTHRSIGAFRFHFVAHHE